MHTNAHSYEDYLVNSMVPWHLKVGVLIVRNGLK